MKRFNTIACMVDPDLGTSTSNGVGLLFGITLRGAILLFSLATVTTSF